MGKSPILQLDELTQGMVQAFQAANNNSVAIEDSNNRDLIIDGSDPLNLTLLPLDILRYFVFRVQGLTGDDTLIFPHEVDDITPVATQRVLVVRNENDYYLTCTTDGTPGATVIIPPQGTRMILIDDQDIYLLCEGGAVTGVPHTVGVFSFGTPGSSDEMLRYNFVERITYAENFAGSFGSIRTTITTDPFDMDVQKNGVSIGTVSIDISDVYTFTLAAPETFEPGDVMTVIAPASVDATAAGIAFTLKGAR